MDQKEAAAVDVWGLLDSTGDRDLTVWVHGEYYVQRRGSPVASKNVYRYTDDGMLQSHVVPRLQQCHVSMKVMSGVCKCRISYAILI
jgi:hypothetical protein